MKIVTEPNWYKCFPNATIIESATFTTTKGEIFILPIGFRLCAINESYTDLWYVESPHPEDPNHKTPVMGWVERKKFIRGWPTA